jgi:hypothetical protein
MRRPLISIRYIEPVTSWAAPQNVMRKMGLLSFQTQDDHIVAGDDPFVQAGRT